MRFYININMGNDAMESADDLSNAIEKVADRIASEQYDINPDDEYEVPITDDNGNTVGEWGFEYD